MHKPLVLSIALVVSGLAASYAAGASASDLATINVVENRAHRYGEPTTLGIDGVYDCEDYAWAKWRAVLASGAYGYDDLRVVMLTTRRGESHTVLVVRSGDKLVVLDSRYNGLATVRDLERNGDRPLAGWWPE